ncbi:MAG: crotonobetainyl-CoA:carnitine CoA-transferase CaiB-like acyl-CoA transferase [Bacteroidia bacterium]|jgi:crotonobetainyl-CoA:carnitine CoA-transferase CaiB-like acyl-CoA transferase
MKAALEGLRVLDLSTGIAGPMTGMVLSDNGANVIKIESPEGDPHWDKLGYRAWQRGKRNAVYDMKNQKQRLEFLDLVKTADILLESFSPGVTAKLGIDYASLKDDNPGLIYCSITAYGRDNIFSQRPAVDALVAANAGLHYEQRGRLGGMFYGTGREIPLEDFPFNPEGVVGPRHHDRDGPLFPATYWPSMGASYAAMTAINAALYVREICGRGQWVETSLLQGSLTAGTLAFSRADNPEAPHFATWINDSRHPKGNFQCSDCRWVLNWVPNPSFVLGASEGKQLNPKPDTSARQDPDRIMPAVEDSLVLDHYYTPMSEAFKRFSADEWVEAGVVAGQCIQKIRSPEDGLNDPLLLNDGCVAEVTDPELGQTRQVGVLFNLEKHSNGIKQGIAKPGEHSGEVRGEAGNKTFKRKFVAKKKMPARPLEGIRVLDMGVAIAGPFAAQVLSDLGADVIKLNATYDWYWHSNAIAMSANRGKRSIAVDMRNSEGVALIQKLALSCDVVVHNMRYKAVEGKGLDYDTLKALNPRLIYCHTRGFEKGPRAALPGNDQTGSALAGVQWEDGACAHDGGRPYWSQTTLGDTGNGYLAAIAVMQALRSREQSGEGQFVDTSIINAHLFNCSQVIAPAGAGAFDRPHLRADALGYSAGYRLYRCKDEYICLAIQSEPQWQALVELFGLAESFTAADYRKARDEELNGLLEKAFVQCQSAEIWQKLDGLGIPCEIENAAFHTSMWQADDFLIQREWLVNLPHPVLGTVGHVGVPYELSETPAEVQSPPLIVGQYTREILTELGYSKAEQEALFAASVVADESCYMYDLNLGQSSIDDKTHEKAG